MDGKKLSRIKTTYKVYFILNDVFYREVASDKIFHIINIIRTGKQMNNKFVPHICYLTILQGHARKNVDSEKLLSKLPLLTNTTATLFSKNHKLTETQQTLPTFGLVGLASLVGF